MWQKNYFQVLYKDLIFLIKSLVVSEKSSIVIKEHQLEEIFSIFFFEVSIKSVTM